MKTILYVLVICWILALPVPAPAHDPDPAETEPSSEPSLLLFPISFYQKIISPAVGNRCQMSPSCSAYSKEAFQTHGFFIGWFMTCDRLMRCGRDETHLSPGIGAPEGRLTLDPLSGNDSWLK
jgi:uncharacterized protein